MSRHRSIITTFVAALACACGEDRDDGTAGLTTIPGDSGSGEDAAASESTTDGSDGPDASSDDGGPADDGATADDSADAESSDGGSDPTGDGDGTEPHGEGMCGGGFGASNDLAHVPLCPSDPLTFHERFLATRGNYYHDGEHVFEPGIVEWDDTLAAAAQEYAEAYAGGMAPNGMEYSTPAYVYDPYWDGTWQGYRAIAGMETPTSCTCTVPDPTFGMSESYVFYNAASAYFRANVVRIDGLSRMGIGHVAPGDGSHYWTLLFAE